MTDKYAVSGPWDYAPIALALAVGYALGSLPFGIILSRLAGAPDPRGIGSGNIGATNVLRSGRKGLAAATLLLDLLKGTAAVLLARFFLAQEAGALAGAGALVGHIYPVWLGFRGGKGVATFAGVMFGLGWPLGLGYAAVWLGTLAATRISSLGGLAAAISAPVAALLLGDSRLALLLAALSALVVWKHRANIARLRRGEEPRIGRPPPGGAA